MMNILVADDDRPIRELVAQFLRSEGYNVFEASDGQGGMEILEEKTVHLAVVDIMMPNKDGYQMCKEIREDFDIPVILLTAKDQLIDKEKGYLVGTDDYLTKPFEPKELLFRIKALLRRYEMASAEKIKMNQVVIDRKSYEVNCHGRILMLPMKEFELLYQLASYPDRVFTREELIELIWGQDFEGDDRTVDVHIKRLRERFAQYDDFRIQTVRGVGYKMEVS
ncbi:response regulator transcription factor [Bacillus sp. 1P06AnD]|uniref:response regulator transcription factor n=1 Tax=Bacillus sp. 1P06AnD TaxID=3132208 RepID=UPI0039A0FD82